MLVVYFSSVTDNTHRFVQKLDLPNVRIPLRLKDEPLIVNEPYVLVCPTYGGGVSLTGENSRPVPRQVIRFLNNEHNRSFIRAVVAGGNSNFGADFGLKYDKDGAASAKQQAKSIFERYKESKKNYSID